MKIVSTQQQQQKAVMLVSDTFKQYKDLLQPYHDRLLAVYTELNTFRYPKRAERSTTFKVNKMHEVSNKILPRIVSRNPKWIVSYKPDLVTKNWSVADVDNLSMQAQAVQDLLNTIFDKYNLLEWTRLWAKGMVNYWVWFAKVVTKYEISRSIEKVDETEIIIDNGVEVEVPVKEKIKEKVASQYSIIEPVSWTDLYYDPRYVQFQDMPAVIEVVGWVRLSEIKKNKDYINVDKLEDISKLDRNSWSYKEDVQQIVWLTMTGTPIVDKNNLNLKEYYWLWDRKDNGDERLYKISVVNDMLCIGIEEITNIPYEQIRCFEDTETNFSTWFLETILGLQQEMNYKKNAASEYINHALNRSYIRSPNSWINPKKLISKPNNIIPTNKTVDDAMKNLQELPHRQLDASYFQEQNDFERQIQWQTFTIDTNNSQNQQGLTNTATGMRIKFFESNVVIDEVRKHYEKGLENIAYKLLTEIAENMDENITIKALWDDSFREINQEAIKNSLEKFEIKVEAGSSSYDSIENRRDEAIAKGNIALQYAWAGVPVNLEEVFKDTLGTFEGVNPQKYIQKQQQAMPWMPWGVWQLDQLEPTPTNAEDITQAVAQGNITGV